jgi:hypothetical protein
MTMNTNPMQEFNAAARNAAPANGADLHALFGEYAALAQHPGEEDDRLALAIRVVEALGMERVRPS